MTTLRLQPCIGCGKPQRYEYEDCKHLPERIQVKWFELLEAHKP
jgi:hypothetical protein